MVVFVFAAAATATNYGSASPWSSDQVSLVHVGDAFAVEAFSSHAIVVSSHAIVVVSGHDDGYRFGSMVVSCSRIQGSRW